MALDCPGSRGRDYDGFLAADICDVTGVLLIVGNDACAGLPCTETIAFSFDLGYEFNPEAPTYRAYISNVADNWSGPLGSFSQTITGLGATANADQNDLAFSDPTGEEIDIHVIQGFVSTLPSAVTFSSYADLYSCGTTTCVTDFAPSFFQGRTPPVFGLFVGGPAEFTVTAIPEPATFSLLLCGLFVLGIKWVRSVFQSLDFIGNESRRCDPSRFVWKGSAMLVRVE